MFKSKLVKHIKLYLLLFAIYYIRKYVVKANFYFQNMLKITYIINNIYFFKMLPKN